MSKIYTAKPGDPAKINITAKKNDTFLYEITGYNKDGTPYDFTGHEFLLQVKKQGATDEDDALIDMTNDSFTITQNSRGSDAEVNNVVEIEHSKDDMNVDAKCYDYDLQMTDADDKDQTIQEGTFTVTQDKSN